MLRRLAVLGAVLAAAGGAALSAGSTSPAARSTAYVYDLKMAVGGSMSFTDDFQGEYTENVIQEHGSGSYTLSASIPARRFFGAKLPPGASSGGSARRGVVVDGSWSAAGTKWLDVTTHTSAPFSCGGKIVARDKPSAMGIRWSREGAAIVFVLETTATLLDNDSWEYHCADQSSAGWSSHLSLDVYRTEFSVPLRQLGRKSIVAPISGPPAETLDDVRSCGDRCSSNLGWHGTVRFTLVRTVSTGA